MKSPSVKLLIFIMLLPSIAGAVEFVFDKPSDDIWQYPFNFNKGNADTGKVFGSPGNVTFNGFNDRDGVIIAAWDTDTLIPMGQAPSSYNIAAITVTLTHQDCPPGDCGLFVTPATWPIDLTIDEWFTFDVNNNGLIDNGEQPDLDPGRPFELYGVGFENFMFDSWNEDDNFVTSTCQTGVDVCNFVPRDPYPMMYRLGTGEVMHVEDNIHGAWNPSFANDVCGDPDASCPFTPTPWAIGHPINYNPDGTQTDPFEVVFDVNLNLSGGLVRQYFQEQLAGGRVIISVSSLFLIGVQELGSPTFWLKEATEPFGGFPPIPGAVAPKLTIVFQTPATGDYDGNNVINSEDYASLAACLAGPMVGPPINATKCLDVFDFNRDDDVDMNDAAVFVNRFQGDG